MSNWWRELELEGLGGQRGPEVLCGTVWGVWGCRPQWPDPGDCVGSVKEDAFILNIITKKCTAGWGSQEGRSLGTGNPETGLTFKYRLLPARLALFLRRGGA